MSCQQDGLGHMTAISCRLQFVEVVLISRGPLIVSEDVWRGDVSPGGPALILLLWLCEVVRDSRSAALVCQLTLIRRRVPSDASGLMNLIRERVHSLGLTAGGMCVWPRVCSAPLPRVSQFSGLVQSGNFRLRRLSSV